MTRHREPFDLRMTNDRHAQKDRKLQAYRQRTGKRRNQRRQVDLIGMLVRTGAMQR
jgi:hypothetical protein